MRIGTCTSSTTILRPTPSDLRAQLLADIGSRSPEAVIATTAEATARAEDARIKEIEERVKDHCKLIMFNETRNLKTQNQIVAQIAEEMKDHPIYSVKENWLRCNVIGRRNIALYKYVKEFFTDPNFEKIQQKWFDIKSKKVLFNEDKSGPKITLDETRNESNAIKFEEIQRDLEAFLPDFFSHNEKWTIQNLYHTYYKLDEKRLYYVKLVYQRMFHEQLQIKKSQENEGDEEVEELEPVDWEKKYYDLLKLYEELLARVASLENNRI